MRAAVDALRQRFATHVWTPVAHGESGDAVWRLTGRPDLYVKVGAVAGEADRLTWLRAQGLPAPEVVDAGDSWLVTCAVAGEPASAPWPAADRDRVVDALADITRTLHQLAVETCPFDRTLTTTRADAAANVARGTVDLADLDSERAGWTAEQLLAELDATAPQHEDLVVAHGDLCLPNVLIDPATVRATGLIDVGRLGVADRYTDLALITRSLGLDPRNAQFGERQVERFLAAYGVTDADHAQLAFYRLLDEFF